MVRGTISRCTLPLPFSFSSRRSGPLSPPPHADHLCPIHPFSSRTGKCGGFFWIPHPPLFGTFLRNPNQPLESWSLLPALAYMNSSPHLIRGLILLLPRLQSLGTLTEPRYLATVTQVIYFHSRAGESSPPPPKLLLARDLLHDIWHS